LVSHQPKSFCLGYQAPVLAEFASATFKEFGDLPSRDFGRSPFSFGR